MLAAGEKAPALHQPPEAAAFVFFRVSCPVCQMALPFLDRIATAGLRVVAVSQDDAEATAEFRTELGISNLETTLDAPPYPASRAFRITSVPSLFIVEADGLISKAVEGFSKSAFAELGERFGLTVFSPTDRVPVFRPG